MSLGHSGFTEGGGGHDTDWAKHFCMPDEAPDPSASRSQNDGKFRHAYFGRLVRLLLLLSILALLSNSRSYSRFP